MHYQAKFKNGVVHVMEVETDLKVLFGRWHRQIFGSDSDVLEIKEVKRVLVQYGHTRSGAMLQFHLFLEPNEVIQYDQIEGRGLDAFVEDPKLWRLASVTPSEGT